MPVIVNGQCNGEIPGLYTDPQAMTSIRLRCQIILNEIRSALRTVTGRYQDWIENRQGRRDKGHIKAYQQAQQRLRNALANWKKHNCGDLPDDVKDAEDWVNKPLP